MLGPLASIQQKLSACVFIEETLRVSLMQNFSEMTDTEREILEDVLNQALRIQNTVLSDPRMTESNIKKHLNRLLLEEKEIDENTKEKKEISELESLFETQL